MSLSSIFNQFGLNNINASLFRSLAPDIVALIDASKALVEAQSNFSNQLNTLAQNLGMGSGLCRPAPIAPPAIEDSFHPAGSLKTDGNSITTAGGYKIEMLGQFDWQITGPDGKSTKIWGDPHVAEGDGGTWDFKRNSTFVLGDGTRINVTTKPWGGNMTVTGQLEVISGNDRVIASDIDKGKGKIGTVTQDGYQHVNSFQGDVFVQGRETDDWSFTGKEIIGSNNGGDSFKLGGDLDPALNTVDRFGGGLNWAQSVFDGLMNKWSDGMRSNNFGSNPYSGNIRAGWEGGVKYNRAKHIQHMRKAFRALGNMFTELSKVASLSQQLSIGRHFRIQV